MTKRLNLPVDQLIKYRRSTIRKLLKPIAKVDAGPACDFAPGTGNAKILGTHDGYSLPKNFTQWRFASIVSQIFIAYYELWKLGADNQCFIERAYMQIYKVNKLKRNERKIVCLHCDPNEPEHTILFIYKCIPHIHMQTAEYPLNHSHIPLALGQNDTTFESLDNFNNFLTLGIEFIRDEILERYNF